MTHGSALQLYASSRAASEDAPLRPSDRPSSRCSREAGLTPSIGCGLLPPSELLRCAAFSRNESKKSPTYGAPKTFSKTTSKYVFHLPTSGMIPRRLIQLRIMVVRVSGRFVDILDPTGWQIVDVVVIGRHPFGGRALGFRFGASCQPTSNTLPTCNDQPQVNISQALDTECRYSSYGASEGQTHGAVTKRTAHLLSIVIYGYNRCSSHE